MFFASDSPHYQRAAQLATATAPVGNGAIFTFGTPDTYLECVVLLGQGEFFFP